MPPRRSLTFAAAVATAGVIVGAVLMVGHAPQSGTPAAETAPTPLATPDDGSWAATAAALPLISGDDAPPYQRTDFGERWVDIDGNGCGQRDDVLARDLTNLVRSACTVSSGSLDDPYTGETIAYPRVRSVRDGEDVGRGVRLDRIVSLRSAHEGGAWTWPAERRLQFANSTENMLAVDDETAQLRAGRGPGSWLPPDGSFVCEYAIRYTWIVNAWGLAVTADDRDALAATLIDCER